MANILVEALRPSLPVIGGIFLGATATPAKILANRLLLRVDEDGLLLGWRLRAALASIQIDEKRKLLQFTKRKTLNGTTDVMRDSVRSLAHRKLVKIVTESPKVECAFNQALVDYVSERRAEWEVEVEQEDMKNARGGM